MACEDRFPWIIHGFSKWIKLDAVVYIGKMTNGYWQNDTIVNGKNTIGSLANGVIFSAWCILVKMTPFASICQVRVSIVFNLITWTMLETSSSQSEANGFRIYGGSPSCHESERMI